MRIRRKGIFRVWIVLAVVFTLGFAEWEISQMLSVWETLNNNAIKACVDNEDVPGHSDVMACEHQLGADQTAFQHEHTTAGRAWAEAIALAFVLYLILTAILAGVFYVFRWVVRGFKAEDALAD